MFLVLGFTCTAWCGAGRLYSTKVGSLSSHAQELHLILETCEKAFSFLLLQLSVTKECCLYREKAKKDVGWYLKPMLSDFPITSAWVHSPGVFEGILHCTSWRILKERWGPGPYPYPVRGLWPHLTRCRKPAEVDLPLPWAEASCLCCQCCIYQPNCTSSGIQFFRAPKWLRCVLVFLVQWLWIGVSYKVVCSVWR